jgi:hypothetical protein
MDIEHIKPATVSTFRVILYSTTHLFMLFIDRHILMLNIATYNWNSLSIKGNKESYKNEI